MAYKGLLRPMRFQEQNAGNENKNNGEQQEKKGFFGKIKNTVVEHPVASAAGVAVGVGATVYVVSKIKKRKNKNQDEAEEAESEEQQETEKEKVEAVAAEAEKEVNKKASSKK